MKAYLYDVWHRCESITDWIAYDCSLAVDSAEKIEGGYSIKLTTTIVVLPSMRYDRDVDWSDFDAILFSVYMPGWVDEKGRMLISSGGANYKIWDFDFAGSWTERTIDFSTTPDVSVGALDWANITYLRIYVYNAAGVVKDYYFDFFRGRINITDDITYFKITEEMGLPSVAELKIKGASLELFQAGLEMEVYDKDDELSWRGRILYPEGVMEGTEVVGKIKAIGADSQFQNTYRKDYTTARDSDYIIKDIIDNALTKYHTYDDEIDNFTLTAKYDLKTKIQKMFSYLSMLERAVIGAKPDGEMFFNKYDNLSKGPQIYQGTYNFEDEAVGTSGTDIDFVDTETGTFDSDIVAVIDGHKKVLRGKTDNVSYTNSTHNITAQANGTIEYYWHSTNTGLFCQDLFYSTATIAIQIALGQAADQLGYQDAGGWHNIVAVADNTTYYLRIDFECGAGAHEGLAADTFYVTVGSTRYGPYNFRNATDNINKIALVNNITAAKYVYHDAFGFSWDANYDVGDNLKCWDESTKKIMITSYTPAANRHVTRAPVIGANNDLGQVYYVGKAVDSVEQKYGINYLQTWRDSEISNYAEAKQLGDNLLAIYSLDTQMVSMLVVGKGHLQVAKTLNVGWAGVFSITQGDILLTKRVWYPIPDISELELTDNILTKKAFNVKVINKFYDEDAQQSYEEPDVSESTVDGTVESLYSLAQLRSPTFVAALINSLYDGINQAYSENLTERSTVSVGVYVKLKEIEANETMRDLYVTWEAKYGGLATSYTTRVYKNGVYIDGATFNGNSAAWELVKYTYAGEVVDGDTIEIWAQTWTAGRSVNVKNLKIGDLWAPNAAF